MEIFFPQSMNVHNLVLVLSSGVVLGMGENKKKSSGFDSETPSFWFGRL